MLYDDIVAEFRWSPEQMSAPFDLHAANELVRKKIESRRGPTQPDGQNQRPRARQKSAKAAVAGGGSSALADNSV
ncbi:MAG: hypothetical protein ACRDPS_21865 [Nocardioides sp.]|uniref:hypothetical protein n=1 Tax=Nocardioides sp. TaxID=35761 RepID=UPI003D6BCAEA